MSLKHVRYFNGEKIESSERCLISFDGTYATLFIASCTMDDMGDFKVVFENKSGSDESTGKVTVKPVSDPPPHSKSQIFKFRIDHCIYKLNCSKIAGTSAKVLKTKESKNWHI